MHKTVIKAIVVGIAAFAFAGQASAAGWEVWTEKQNADSLSIVTSYGGDGVADEAQIDLNMKSSFEVLSVKTLQKGAVCVASAEKNILRSVPPSGAGVALKSKALDACMFTIRINASTKIWKASDMVALTETVCASSEKGMIACGAEFNSIK